MGKKKVVEKKRKKKKGRPSLLDLQKRNLRLQKQQLQEEEQQQRNKRNSYPNPNPNPNPNPSPYSNLRNPIAPKPNPNPNRRFTRRNPISDDAEERADDAADDEEDDEDDWNGKRREKKLKFVLRLPSSQQNQGSLSDSQYLNWDLYGSDSNAEDENDEAPKKKRKVNAVRHGLGRGDGEKGEKQDSTSKATGTNLGTSIEAGPTPLLPDKKLLVFILDRLQKKDTYGVFSEPVDPKELPDYHEIIKHPMDFGTLRKKLDAAAYSNLEEFEKDVLLICTNAMQYNAPDTIYFRQARSMHELAKKNFENLRQDSDDNEPETKIVRRGRPPTKNLKKPLGKALSERAGSEFSSDATLVLGGENASWSNTYNLRKGPLSDKSGFNDASGRTSRSNGVYASWLTEHKSERNDECPGSISKGFSLKFGKKQLVIDENRRGTYELSHQSIGLDSSVLTTFDVEKKQLMAVGLHTEHGYARSLARFATNLGPVAWNIASKKIARALPAGVKFGPGWVGENETPVHQPPPSTVSSPQTVPRQPCPSPNISSSSTTTPLTSSMVVSDGNKLSEEKLLNIAVLDSLKNRTFPMPTSASSSAVINGYPESVTKGVETSSLNNGSGNIDLASGSSFGIRPPFQVNQSPNLNPALNGISGGGFNANFASQMHKAASPAWPSGSYSSEAFMHSQRLDMLTRNNFVPSMPAKQLEMQNPKLSGTSNGVVTSTSSPNASIGTLQCLGAGVHLQPSWQVSSQQQKPESAPPDLNLRFQSPGSPSSGVRVDSPQPDLALQL